MVEQLISLRCSLDSVCTVMVVKVNGNLRTEVLASVRALGDDGGCRVL
jgi:hypothetical protein